MADTSPSNSSTTSQASEQSEEIADGDNVSRQVIAPRMGAIGNFDWPQVFEFQSNGDPRLNRTESVVWRRIAISDNDVHVLGKERESALRSTGKTAQYLGFMTARAS